eukprot:gene4488-8927_t
MSSAHWASSYPFATSSAPLVTADNDVLTKILKSAVEDCISSGEADSIIRHVMSRISSSAEILDSLAFTQSGNEPINGSSQPIKGWTALTFAACFGQFDCLRILLEARAFDSVQDKSGCTPLIHAARYGRTDCVRILLEMGGGGGGANKDIQNNNGNTALIWAAYNGASDCAKSLLEAGANKDLQNKELSLCALNSDIMKNNECLAMILDHISLLPLPLLLVATVVAETTTNTSNNNNNNSNTLPILSEGAKQFWLRIITSKVSCTNPCLESISRLLDRHIDHISIFSNVTDTATGKRAFDVALPTIQKLIEDRILFLMRYEIRPGSYDGDKDEIYRIEAEKKGFYKFCLVTTDVERNLKFIISYENTCRNDWNSLKFITIQLIEAVDHMHAKGYIHGDIKPLNFIHINNRFMLSNLDGSAALPTSTSTSTSTSTPSQFVGGKCSSGYVPPEMLVVTKNGDVIMKTFNSVDKVTMLPQLPPPVSSSDAGDTRGGVGVVDTEQLFQLYHWSPVYKYNKLRKVSNSSARNLLSRLLSKDPRQRLNTSQLLHHPFISKRENITLNNTTTTTRVLDHKPAEYDVYISYRTNSGDVKHAEILYNKLISLGLNVYWDKVCLPSGTIGSGTGAGAGSGGNHLDCIRDILNGILIARLLQMSLWILSNYSFENVLRKKTVVTGNVGYYIENDGMRDFQTAAEGIYAMAMGHVLLIRDGVGGRGSDGSYCNNNNNNNTAISDGSNSHSQSQSQQQQQYFILMEGLTRMSHIIITATTTRYSSSANRSPSPTNNRSGHKSSGGNKVHPLAGGSTSTVPSSTSTSTSPQKWSWSSAVVGRVLPNNESSSGSPDQKGVSGSGSGSGGATSGIIVDALSTVINDIRIKVLKASTSTSSSSHSNSGSCCIGVIVADVEQIERQSNTGQTYSYNRSSSSGSGGSSWTVSVDQLCRTVVWTGVDDGREMSSQSQGSVCKHVDGTGSGTVVYTVSLRSDMVVENIAATVGGDRCFRLGLSLLSGRERLIMAFKDDMQRVKMKTSLQD